MPVVPAPDRPAPTPVPAPPPRFLRRVVDLRPGDRVCRAPAVRRVTRFADRVEVETEDGKVESFALAGDPAIEVE